MTYKVVLSTLIFVLQGCASVGESDFKCGGIDVGIKCKPVSAIYSEVTDSNYSGDRAEQVETSQSLVRKGLSLGAGERSIVSTTHQVDVESTKSKPTELLIMHKGNPDSLVLVNPPTSEKTPIRIGEIRERVWLSHYVDSNGDYHDDKFIFFSSQKAGWKGSNSEVHKYFEPLKN